MKQTACKAVIFDLDGTLIDSLADLAAASNRVLESMDAPTHPPDAYRYFVGDGLAVLVKRMMPTHATDAQLAAAVEKFNQYYEKNWDNQTRPYGGIMEMLEQVQRCGIKVNVLSNKPDEFTQIYVKRYFPQIDFSFVYGGRASVPKKPAPDGALKIADSLNIAAADCMFVGDTRVDIETGKSAGMTTVGVTWGFRGRAELEESGAEIIIDSPRQLLDHVYRTD